MRRNAPAYRTLPAEFARADIGGTPYWHHGGRFYKQDAERGFLLVQPPRGHEAVVATASGAPAPNADPVAAPKKSWLKSGGGKLIQADHATRTGRSPIRRKRRIYSPE